MDIRMAQVSGLLFLSIFFLAPECFALSSPGNSWSEVNQLVKAGKFDEAYQLLRSRPEASGTYYYDLGTLASRLGQTGPAVAYLEKANRILPHDPDIQHNLNIARDTLGGVIGTDRLDPASTWMEQVADHIAMKELRGALGLISLLLALYWIMSLLRNQSLKRILLSSSSKLGCLALILVLALYGMEREAEDHPAAVVLSRQTVRSGPGESFSELGQVDSGAKVRLLGPRAPASSPDQEDERILNATLGESRPPAQSSTTWLQVRYTSDNVGWIPASELVILN